MLDALPCAVYLVRDDPGLTLLHGNPRFYALFGCTPEEMRCQYANRLGALTDLDLPRSGGDGRCAGFRLRIRRGGGGAWIDTQAVPCRYQGSPGFLCSSFDVTEDQRQLGCEFRRIVEQNKMVWMELQVHLFREPFSRHVLALLSITNIDRIKKQQAWAGPGSARRRAGRGRRSLL